MHVKRSVDRVAIDPVSRRVHNAWLDWLRFFAAFEVVLTHARTMLFVEYAQLDPASHTLPVMLWTAVTRLGYEAVMVFFVLSGFLVGGPALQRSLERRFSLPDYFIDRVVRIMVPLVGAIVFSLIAAMVVRMPLSPVTVIGNLLSLQGAFVEVLPINFPLWSLSYEVWFYVIGGAVAFMLTRRAPSFLAALALVAAAIIFAQLLVGYLLLWFGGAAAYLYRPRRMSVVQVIIGAALVFGGILAYQLSLPRTGTPDPYRPGQGLGGALMLFGLAVVLPNLRASNWTAGRLAQIGTFFASFSYSLYLIHMPVLEMWPIRDMTSVTPAATGAYAAAVFTALIAAFIFSRCFETTGPRIKAFLRERRRSSVSR